MMRISPVAGLLALALLGAAPAAAQGPAAAPPATQPAAATDPAASPPALTGSITPYVWLPAMSGSLQTPLPRAGDRGFDLSSGTVFTGLSTVPVMLMGELRYDRFLVLADFFHAGITQDISTPRDLLWTGGHVRALSTFGTVLGMLRAVEVPGQSLDLGAGLRAWSFNNKISLNPGLLSGVIQRSTVSWVDPILAARYQARLATDWGVSLYGDVGGFGAGSRLTWQAMGAVDYSLTRATTLSAGWRYLSVDKTRGSVGVDLGFNGPFLAATFRF
jgi:hypothetical protein